MLGHLGGLILFSFLFVRNKRYTAVMTVLYAIIALVVEFGIPL